MICKVSIYILFLLLFGNIVFAQQANDILGRWISAQRNVMVDLYKDSTGFRGKVVWFDDSDDISRPMKTRKDVNNPVKALRNQKIIGLDVLKGLAFNVKCKCWQNGKIYDVQSGKTWSASITLLNKNLLKVRGFWHYEFIGKTMTFRRVR